MVCNVPEFGGGGLRCSSGGVTVSAVVESHFLEANNVYDTLSP